VLASELRLPLFVARFDSLITKFMGESASKLRLLFDAVDLYTLIANLLQVPIVVQVPGGGA
jgi:hypothetical protein